MKLNGKSPVQGYHLSVHAPYQSPGLHNLNVCDSQRVREIESDLAEDKNVSIIFASALPKSLMHQSPESIPAKPKKILKSFLGTIYIHE